MANSLAALSAFAAPTLMPPQSYVGFSVLLSFSTVSYVLLFEGLRSIRLRYFVADRYERNALSFKMECITLVLVAVLLLAAVVAAIFMKTNLAALLFYASFQGAFEYQQAILRSQERATRFAALWISRAFLGFVLLFVSTKFGASSEAVVASIGAGFGVMFVIAAMMRLREFHDSYRDWRRSFVPDQLPQRELWGYGVSATLGASTLMVFALSFRYVFSEVDSFEASAVLVVTFDYAFKSLCMANAGATLVVQRNTFALKDKVSSKWPAYSSWVFKFYWWMGAVITLFIYTFIPVIDRFGVNSYNLSENKNLILIALGCAFLVVFKQGAAHLLLQAERNLRLARKMDTIFLSFILALLLISVLNLISSVTLAKLLMAVGVLYFASAISIVIRLTPVSRVIVYSLVSVGGFGCSILLLSEMQGLKYEGLFRVVVLIAYAGAFFPWSSSRNAK